MQHHSSTRIPATRWSFRTAGAQLRACGSTAMRGALLFIACCAAVPAANAQRIGDWDIERARDLVIASTRSSNDSVFGYACSRVNNECQFFFMPDGLRCNDGGRYAVLMNGGQESTARTAVCRRLGWSEGQQYANVLEGIDGLRRQLFNADEGSIGIARGTGGDGFSISKFSLRGFRSAYERVSRARDETGRPGDYTPGGRVPVPVPGPGHGHGGGPFLGDAEVELFEHDDFRGRRVGVRADRHELDSSGFNDVASSIVVHRGQWEACADEHHRGRCKVFGPGRYPDLGEFGDQISSVRRLR